MLSRLLTPIFRISFGIVGIFLSLLMVAFMIGLLPNRETLELDARGNFAEALALQLSSAASNHDTRTLSQTMDAVVERNDELLSIAIRRNDGVLLLLAGDHDQHWKAPEENRSNPTHVQVALSDGKRVWGRIEMAFTPLPSSAKILGVPESLTDLLVFLGCMGFAGSFLVLKRALKELDPGSVIPDRVQSAFNSLTEGILILDERGIILLANDAFAETIGKNQKALFGTEVSELSWRQSGSGGRVNDYPWQVAVDSRLDVTGSRLSYRISEDEMCNFVVNATCIGGADGRVSGIIATFDDVTELEQKNDDLEAAVRQLRQSEEEISKQNRDLQYLASHDPLTGCLNRRAFFEQFTILLEEAHRDSRMLTCMMADLDHFKSVNDTYGHAVGDQVIIGMANVLKKACGDVGLVGRYGGEEFCLVLPDLDLEQSREAAEQIRAAVYRQSGAWLQIADRHVTSSIGIAMRPSSRSEVGEIVDWADQALYQAKETGRNKVIVWQADEQQLEQSAAGKMQEKAAPDHVPAGEKEGASIANDAHLPEQAIQLPAAATAGVGDTPQMAGLPSELIFKDRVEQAIARADWDDKIVALLEVRLEQVEQIGTLYGEALLSDFFTIVSSRFKSALKRGDTISTLDGSKRIPSLCLGGNGTFFVEISDLEETNTVVWIVKRLIDSLAAPVTIHNDVIYADTHIGISLYPADGSDVEGLMRSARTARQYAEKMEGKNNYQFFSEDMNQSSRRQMSMEASIRQALDKDLFALHYQPIIDIATGRVNAMEALLRSEHSAFSGVPIGSLIAVAEQTGLIIPIGEWVLRAAIQQIHRWQREGVDVPRISINLSAIQLSNKAAMVRIIKILAEMPISTSLIQVEVTETAMLRDSEAAAQCLEQIRELGILIALDDFGTGQSSLAYLRRFQPDILKIDRCFIGEITASQSDETLVSAIVTMAQRLDIEVVAEGVETKKQAQKLNDIGCDSLQGFYFSRPMPAEKASHWLREHVGVDLIEEGGLSFEPSNQVA